MDQISRLCWKDTYYSEAILRDATFDSKRDALTNLDEWAKEHGALRRLDFMGSWFVRAELDETDHDRAIQLQRWRIVAWYLYPEA
jgi:hypothetical protein